MLGQGMGLAVFKIRTLFLVIGIFLSILVSYISMAHARDICYNKAYLLAFRAMHPKSIWQKFLIGMFAIRHE